MKYFTADIWAGWQRKATFEPANRKWKRNLEEYGRKLVRIAPRLGRRSALFFTKHSLHDGDLLSFAVSDWPQPPSGKRNTSKRGTSVELAVLSWGRNADLYRLFYSRVDEIVVTTKNDLFPCENSRFGDWGYDELLAERRGLFRHNILFQTGTEISIVFGAFRFKVERPTPKRLKAFERPWAASR
jgi:hypothetical protein